MQVLLLDSNSLLNRAYYAMPNLTDRSGLHTGAIFGYMNMLINVLDKYQPTHAVAVFDRKAPVFRKSIYAGYKAQRKPMPEELAEQLEPLKGILRAMGIPVAELDGFEADDIIGSISRQWEYPAFIVTGDKDSLQLVNERVHVLLTKKGVSDVEDYTPERLKEDGLTPAQVIDLKRKRQRIFCKNTPRLTAFTRIWKSKRANSKKSWKRAKTALICLMNLPPSSATCPCRSRSNRRN